MLKPTRLIALLTIAIPFFFNAGKLQAQTGYDIKFKIAGLKDTMCYIANYYGDKQYIKDSSIVDNSGKITFKNKEALPGGIYLFVFPNKTYFEFLVDKEQAFSMECDMIDPINTMKVKGSLENERFYNYLAFIQQKSKEVEPLKVQKKQFADNKVKADSIDAAIRAIDSNVIKFKKDYIANYKGSMLSAIFNASQEVEIPEAPLLPSGVKDSTFAYRYYKAHYFDNIDLSDERILRSPIYHNKVSSYLKNLVLQIPDSLIPECDLLIGKAKGNKETFKYMVWFLTNTHETSNIMGMDAVFVHLAKNYYTKELAYWVDAATLYKIQDRANILEPILIGKKVKNIVLADSNDVYQALYNIKTKYTILYFWDPDCGHCKKATPKVKAFYDKVKDKDVQVYAVCTEVEMDKWKKYIQENKLDWINVADPKVQNNFRHDFDITTTPQIFILDKDKKVIAKKIDEKTLEKVMCRELGLPEPVFPPDEDEKDKAKTGH
jgi:thiol-disulfide isomerase/thioredoxin